jgi:hypothetical protein
MSPLHRVALVLITTLILLGIARPVGALDLSPAPSPAESGLWATREVTCKHGSPGVEWTLGNNTNGTHIYSLYVDGMWASQVTVAPGEVRTRSFHSNLWEDSYVHFEVVWKSQGTTIAQTKPWLNCLEPELSYTFTKVDDHGNPCAGLVEVEITNTGNQTADIKLQTGNGLAQHTQFALGVDSSVSKQVHIGTGTWLAGSYLNFGAYEFFLEEVAVDCADALPKLPELPDPPTDHGGGDSPNDETDAELVAQESDHVDPLPMIDEGGAPVSTAPADIAPPAVEHSPAAVTLDLDARIALRGDAPAPTEHEAASGGPPTARVVMLVLLGAAIVGAMAARRGR